MAQGRPAYGSVRKQIAKRIGEAAPELSDLDSIINDFKASAEPKTIVKSETIMIADEGVLAKNRELQKAVVNLEELLHAERRQHHATLKSEAARIEAKWSSQAISKCYVFIGAELELQTGLAELLKDFPPAQRAIESSSARLVLIQQDSGCEAHYCTICPKIEALRTLIATSPYDRCFLVPVGFGRVGRTVAGVIIEYAIRFPDLVSVVANDLLASIELEAEAESRMKE